jgi:Signal peptidase, peptidase S26
LISINGQKPILSRHKKTKRQIIDGVSSSAFHADWSDANSTVSYAVYQMKELPAKIPVFLKTGLSTSYLDKFPLTKDGLVQITLSRDEYFLLSDNRTVGVDSRHYGPVHLSDIHSEVVTPPSMMKMMND